MKRTLALALMLTIFGSTSLAQWCIECVVLPPCSNGVDSHKEAFCGSYDYAAPQGCFSYYKRLRLCPANPEDPPVWGNTYRAVWRLGYVCTGGNDCY